MGKKYGSPFVGKSNIIKEYCEKNNLPLHYIDLVPVNDKDDGSGLLGMPKLTKRMEQLPLNPQKAILDDAKDVFEQVKAQRERIADLWAWSKDNELGRVQLHEAVNHLISAEFFLNLAVNLIEKGGLK